MEEKEATTEIEIPKKINNNFNTKIKRIHEIQLQHKENFLELSLIFWF